MNDVIIVGAGAAGLACAALLVRTGRRPLVLEARPRIGGRIYTLHERGIGLPIELGAEFVHGSPSELVAISRAAGLSLCDAGGEFWRSGRGGPARFAGFDAQLAATLSRMRIRGDTSVSEAVARTRASSEARAAAKSFVQGFDAAPPDETSARWIMRALRRARRQSDYVLVLEDWIWHGTLPLLGYAALVGAAIALPFSSVLALFVVGAASLLLLFVGIHNAWDAVTYIALQRINRTDRPDA